LKNITILGNTLICFYICFHAITRRLRAERRNECPAAVENALYTCEGETMTVYSFKHNKTTED